MRFYNPFKQIRELKTKIQSLEVNQQNQRYIIATLERSLEESVADPALVVKKVFSRGITYYDYEQLTPDLRLTYFEESQLILHSRVFQNEYNYLVATGAQQALLESKDWQGLRDFQMTINGFELLKNRLEQIKDPRNHSSKENLNNPL